MADEERELPPYFTLPMGFVEYGRVIVPEQQVDAADFERNVFAFRAEVPPQVPPEEAERRHQEWLQKQREEWIVYVSAWGRLTAIRDELPRESLMRKVIELHWPCTWNSDWVKEHPDEPFSDPKCWGCDQGCHCDSPYWPCSTMRLLCEELGVDLPEEGTYITRPRDDED